LDYNRENDWVEYRRLVLSELRRLDEKLESQDSEMKDLCKDVSDRITQDINGMNDLYLELRDENRRNREDILSLNIKAGMWGAATAALVLIAQYLLK
jgi:hypothetical protein